MYNVLLTRSEEENIEFIASIKESMFNFESCPLIKYQNIKFDYSTIDQYSDIIISSKYAAKILPLASLHKNIWVVGEESAKILESKNYNIKYIADDFKQLLQNIPKSNYHNMIYLSGNHITKIPPIGIKRVVFYQVRYTNSLDEEQINAIKNDIDYIMLYSSNSARTFLKLLKAHNLIKPLENSIIIAISLKVAEILKPHFAFIICCDEGKHQQMKGLLLNDQKYRSNQQQIF